MIRDDESDDRLMERAAAGDSAAFDLIVRRHQHRLQRFATRMLGGDHAQGADLSVGAFIRLWETRFSYRPTGQLGAWLLRTTYRLCLDALCQTRPTPLREAEPIPSPATGPESCVEQAAIARAVRDAVMELPETHRSVLILSVYEELTYDEISEALEISAGTVASRKNHAIAMLKRRLAAWENR